MDNFTKAELEYLMRKFMLTNGDDFEHNLHDKLESMIANHCDYDINQCPNCGKIF